MKLFLIGLALAELISARAIASRSSRNNNDLADDFGD
jgi:hypothetical protein